MTLEPAGAEPTQPADDDHQGDHAFGDTAKAEPDEYIDELPDDALAENQRRMASTVASVAAAPAITQMGRGGTLRAGP